MILRNYTIWQSNSGKSFKSFINLVTSWEAGGLREGLGGALPYRCHNDVPPSVRSRRWLPFEMKMPKSAPAFNWDNPNIVRLAPETGHAVLPAKWDEEEEGGLERLVANEVLNVRVKCVLERRKQPPDLLNCQRD